MIEDAIKKPRKLARLFGLALAVTLTIGACGSGAASDDASAESSSADLPTLDTSASDDEASGDEEADEDREISEEDAEAAMAEYEKCMADFGIEMNLASAGGSGADVESTQIDEGDETAAVLDEDSFAEAAETCDPILEDAFGDFELSPEQEAEMADQMLEMQKCLADAGFDIDVSEGAFELDADIDFEAFENAMSQCEPAGIETEGSDQ